MGLRYKSSTKPRTTITYRVESDSFIEIIGKRHSYAASPRVKQHDKEAITIFQKQITNKEIKGHAELVRIVTGDSPYSREVIAEGEGL